MTRRPAGTRVAGAMSGAQVAAVVRVVEMPETSPGAINSPHRAHATAPVATADAI